MYALRMGSLAIPEEKRAATLRTFLLGAPATYVQCSTDIWITGRATVDFSRKIHGRRSQFDVELWRSLGRSRCHGTTSTTASTRSFRVFSRRPSRCRLWVISFLVILACVVRSANFTGTGLALALDWLMLRISPGVPYGKFLLPRERAVFARPHGIYYLERRGLGELRCDRLCSIWTLLDQPCAAYAG